MNREEGKVLWTRSTAIVLLVIVSISFFMFGVGLTVFLQDDDPPATQSQVEQLEAIGEQNARLLDTMTECTSPDPDPHDGDDHECYDAAQRRTQEAIAQIIAGIRPASTP